MKVLHVYRTYFPDPPGGLQEAIRQIALSTQIHGVENRIFTLSPTPIPNKINRPEGIVVRTRSWVAPASCDFGFKAAFEGFSKQAMWADIIHFHFPWPFADMLHFLVKHNKPCVMTYHSDVIAKGWLGYIYQPLMKRMLKNMNAVVATSGAYIKSSPVLARAVEPDRLYTVPLGITESSYLAYQQDDRVNTLLQRYNFSVECDDYFLFIGVLRTYKGLDTLVAAAKKTGFTLLIVGIGGELARLRSLVGSSPNIHLLGLVSNAEKMTLIRHCRALILPSNYRSEAFGVVLIEASMCSKPMITCEIGTGTSLVNIDNQTGYVIMPNSVDELTDAMKKLRKNDELVSCMGKAARERYEVLFSGTTSGQAYHDVYSKVVDSILV